MRRITERQRQTDRQTDRQTESEARVYNSLKGLGFFLKLSKHVLFDKLKSTNSVLKSTMLFDKRLV